MSVGSERARENRRLVAKIGVITLASFAFCFALVPLYNIACEQIFGIRVTDGPVGGAAVAANEIDTSRTVTVQFDATVHSGLNWRFTPELAEMRVHPGETIEAWYVASNPGGEPIVGNATYDVSPKQAIPYFGKTECFCFTEQLLAAGETRRMPVRFFVRPDLPAGVSTVTLSYTFYNNEAATRREQAHVVTETASTNPDLRG